MSTDLVLKRTATGASLNRTNVARALAEISMPDGLKCGLSADGLSIHLAVSLPVTDERCAGIEASFAHGGRKLVATTRRGGSPMLYWCLHALAARLGCELYDPQEGESQAPNHEPFLAAATALVTEHENGVFADEPYVEPGNAGASNETNEGDKLLVGFLESLVAAEQLLLAGTADELKYLAPQLKEPAELYEALLDSPLVDDVFVSESEFVSSLSEYRRSR